MKRMIGFGVDQFDNLMSSIQCETDSINCQANLDPFWLGIGLIKFILMRKERLKQAIT